MRVSSSLIARARSNERREATKGDGRARGARAGEMVAAARGLGANAVESAEEPARRIEGEEG